MSEMCAIVNFQQVESIISPTSEMVVYTQPIGGENRIYEFAVRWLREYNNQVYRIVQWHRC